MATFFTMGSASSTHGHEDVAPLELGYNKLLNILLRHFKILHSSFKILHFLD